MTALSLTDHALCRASQRGLARPDLDLILALGTEVEGGFLVTAKDAQAAERKLKLLMSWVRRLKGKRVVIEENRIITAYHVRPRKERSLLRGAEERELRGPKWK
jgi:hypothetical protein